MRRATLSLLRAALSGQPHPLVDLLRRELPISLEALIATLGRKLIDDLEAAGLLERAGGLAHPLARVDLVDDVLVASDLNRRLNEPDFVLGPGPTSVLLARHVPRLNGGTLLDLGCGSGFQSLVRGDRRTKVTAVDINPRALAFTRFNAAINGRPRLRAELGDFLGADPDRRLDDRFDTVVANPPFVLSPVTELMYRDRPLAGDEVGARTVERVARALRPGGRGYVLCNWIDRGGAWSDPVREWTAPLKRDVSVTLVQTLGTETYAAIWTRNLPPDRQPTATRSWADSLVAEGIERIHVGVIVLARPRRPAGSGVVFEPREATLTAVS
jgi:tRNA1(Val) A37 N6-methylase TrmN6